MKNIIAIILLLMCLHVNLYGQDTSKPQKEIALPDVHQVGPYKITMENRDFKITKDPNYHGPPFYKRDTTTYHFAPHLVEIYPANASTPIVKTDLISEFGSYISYLPMAKEEALAKYHLDGGVWVVKLKPGIVLLTTPQLLSKFNISSKDVDLPIFIDGKHHILAPDKLLAIEAAVSRISVVTDIDGYRFINITTKAREAQIKKLKAKQ